MSSSAPHWYSAGPGREGGRERGGRGEREKGRERGRERREREVWAAVYPLKSAVLGLSEFTFAQPLRYL